MTELFYEMAGIRFRVLIPEDCLRDPFRSLSGYIAHPGSWDVECVLSLVEELSEPVGELCFQSPSLQIYRTPQGQLRYQGAVGQSLKDAYLRLERIGSKSTIQLKASAIPRGITDNVLLSCMEAVHQITAAGGFLLHASWICYRDRAILFTGPSGIGKSTQAALWERYRGARLINGDRASVFPVPGGAQVRGVPFCGSSGVNFNETMPLAAVVYLTQAPENSITRLHGSKAFRQVWEGCSIDLWNQEDICKGTQAVANTVAQVPVFHLACTPDEQAVLTLEKEGLF